MSRLQHTASALALASCAIFALGSSSSDKTDKKEAPGAAASGAATPAAATPSAPLKMVPLTIKLANGPIKELVLDAPEGARVEVKGGGTFVTLGTTFSIGIARSSAADIKTERQLAASGHSAKPVVDTDTPELLVFHSDLLGTPRYEFLSSATVDKVVFTCSSASLDDQVYAKDDVPAMTKACKSLRKK